MTMPGANGIGAIARSEDAIARTIADPAASYWVRDALCRAQGRDPLDAANDAALVARLLSDRVDALLADTPAR